MKKLLLSALILSTLLLSCGSEDDLNLIAFETLAIGVNSPVNPGRSEHVINDEAAYEALFGTSANADFDRETVIAVFLGSVGNDNNTFEITEVIDNTASITVRILWKSPRVLSGPNTNHYHVIKTRKLSRPVSFSTTEVRE
jgi:hypothetical protein